MGKQDGSSLIIEEPPRAPRIAKNAKKNYIVAHIWKTSGLFVPLLYIL